MVVLLHIDVLEKWEFKIISMLKLKLQDMTGGFFFWRRNPDMSVRHAEALSLARALGE